MIEKYPSKILLTKSTECTLEEGLEVARLLQEEADSQNWGKVVGMAAPQIGINKRVFLALDLIYINPIITRYSPEKKLFKEGCYSLQKNKFDYEVERSDSISMEYIDRKGRKRNGDFGGFQAQVIQHEYDHLEGRLCNGSYA